MQSDISASAPLISLGIFVTNAKEIADSILTVHSIYNACIVQDLKTFLAVVMKEARETCGGKAFASTLRNLRRYAFSIYIFSCGIIVSFFDSLLANKSGELSVQNPCHNILSNS
jgi:hypothetical protein